MTAPSIMCVFPLIVFGVGVFDQGFFVGSLGFGVVVLWRPFLNRSGQVQKVLMRLGKEIAIGGQNLIINVHIPGNKIFRNVNLP